MKTVEILDSEHFYYGSYMVDLPSILYQIQKLHDGKTSHWVSTSFGAIVRIIEYWDKHKKPTPNAVKNLEIHLIRLAKSGIKGTPFNVRGELLA